MLIPDGDVDALAQHMIKNFPDDAADRAMLRSNAFFVLGRAEMSKKWLQVTEEIKKIQAGQRAAHEDELLLIDTVAPEKSNGRLLPSCRPTSHPAARSGRPADVATEHNIAQITESHIPILIAMVAWSEVIWLIALRT